MYFLYTISTEQFDHSSKIWMNVPFDREISSLRFYSMSIVSNICVQNIFVVLFNVFFKKTKKKYIDRLI